MIKVFRLKTIIATLLSLGMIVAMCISVRFTGAYAVFYNTTPRLVPIYSVEREDKYVSITFGAPSIRTIFLPR